MMYRLFLDMLHALAQDAVYVVVVQRVKGDFALAPRAYQRTRL